MLLMNAYTVGAPLPVTVVKTGGSVGSVIDANVIGLKCRECDADAETIFGDAPVCMEHAWQGWEAMGARLAEARRERVSRKERLT